MGKMPFQRFFAFSVGGGTLWVCVFIYAGHLFGQVPVVRNNFTALIMGIVVLSFMPAIIQLLRSGLAAKRPT
jgi:membrane-associated protein